MNSEETPGIKKDRRVQIIDPLVKQLGFRFYAPDYRGNQRPDAYVNDEDYLYISYYLPNSKHVNEISFAFDESQTHCTITIDYIDKLSEDVLENADIFKFETWEWVQKELKTQINLRFADTVQNLSPMWNDQMFATHPKLGFGSNVALLLKRSQDDSENKDGVYLDFPNYTWVESDDIGTRNVPLLYGDVTSASIPGESETSRDELPSAPDFPVSYRSMTYPTVEPSRVERPAPHTFAHTVNLLNEHINGIIDILKALKYQVEANRTEISELKTVVENVEKILGGLDSST